MRYLRWLFGGITLIIFLFVFLGWLSVLGGPEVEDRSVLSIVFDGPLREAPSSDLNVLLGEEPVQTLRSVVLSLERAAEDERIQGVLLSIGNPEVGFAQLQEIAVAMDAFRESGKWSRSFLETAGELSRGDGAYALAALADEIVLAPAGDINLVGLRTEPLFFAGTLEKLGIDAHFEKRGKYKSAANQFIKREMDEPQRESISDIIGDLQDDLVSLIAARRSQEKATVENWIATGPHLGPEALQRGIVDRLAYGDEVLNELKELTGRDEPIVDVASYWLEGRLHNSGRKIALVYGEGAVMRGESNPGLFDSDPTMASDTLIAAFRALREDGAEAVVFRVDSPGGSYIASDLIRREVQLTREQGIPVVVSMGNAAASGGYFVAMDADMIIADSSTITGSIGVFTGLFDMSQLFQTLGVTNDSLQTGPNADAYSQLAPIDDRRKQLAARAADRVYVDFTTKVADKRGLPLPKVLAVAQGRVWSGRDALEHGLVDQLGGLQTAIATARKLAEIDANAEIELSVWPKPRSPIAALQSALLGAVRVSSSLESVKEPLEAVGELWSKLGAVRGDASLTAPLIPRP